MQVGGWTTTWDRGEAQSRAACLPYWVTSGVIPVVERVDENPSWEEQNDRPLTYSDLSDPGSLSRPLPARDQDLGKACRPLRMQLQETWCSC